jgi:hypothetical protein
MQISILGLILCGIGTLPAIPISDMSDGRPLTDLITSGLFLVSLGLANTLAEKMPATTILWARALASIGLGLLASIPILQQANNEILALLIVTGLAAYIFLTSRKSSL